VISTFQALAVALLFLLPGAAYNFALERVAGSYGSSLADRLVRFLAASAVFQAGFVSLELWLYREYVVAGRLAVGDVPALLLQGLTILYVGVPTLTGSLVGLGQKRRWGWARLLTGEAPEPRARDFLWRRNTEGIVRVRLKSGSWLAGVYGKSPAGVRSYASGYPEVGDVFLSRQLHVDATSGAFQVDAEGRPEAPVGSSGCFYAGMRSSTWSGSTSRRTHGSSGQTIAASLDSRTSLFGLRETRRLPEPGPAYPTSSARADRAGTGRYPPRRERPVRPEVGHNPPADLLTARRPSTSAGGRRAA